MYCKLLYMKTKDTELETAFEDVHAALVVCFLSWGFNVLLQPSPFTHSCTGFEDLL